MHLDPVSFSGNIERFSGYAELYDRYRPQPPAALEEVLTSLLINPSPQLVVDLGCGTGLSTRYWASTAGQVIGIEPSGDMRRQAEALTVEKNIAYREGLSHQTGLPDNCAQIVVCAQALHWMEPQATFEEARRILQPGGVFAATDYDWPPLTPSPQADEAFIRCMNQVRSLENSLTLKNPVRHWDKEKHLARMQASGCFHYTREIVLHHTDTGTASRLIGLLLSQGNVMTLLKYGLSESDSGIDSFRKTVIESLGLDEKTWYWSARIRLGIV